jgi:hypothetical protein
MKGESWSENMNNLIRIKKNYKGEEEEKEIMIRKSILFERSAHES